MNVRSKKIIYHIGIDEVGRGPLAGPVTVCAFVIDQKKIPLLQSTDPRDSKKLSAAARNERAQKIKKLCRDHHCDYAISSVSPQIIDSIGINPAIRRAILQSLKKLDIDPTTAQVFLDGGLKAPAAYIHQQTIIKGDATVAVISAASILAKVHRDHYMTEQTKKYPDYFFEKHMGYGTKKHYAALGRYGITRLHRTSYLKKRR